MTYFPVLQETNVLGFKGPRKMTVILPGMTADHQRVEFRANVEHDSLIGKLMSGGTFLASNHS